MSKLGQASGIPQKGLSDDAIERLEIQSSEKANVEEQDSASSLHLPVLYQDEHIIAINKPPGLLVTGVL